MNTNTTSNAMKTTADLVAFVVSECTPIDREARFDGMLDDCYSFDSIGGPFANMSPSSVLKECDPTAYRCGVNDYADGEGWIEIEGSDYDSDDVEKAREEFMDEMRSELADLESELEELEKDEPEVKDVDEVNRLTGEITAMESRITEMERYTF
jgi:hypothetical protein